MGLSQIYWQSGTQVFWRSARVITVATSTKFMKFKSKNSGKFIEFNFIWLNLYFVQRRTQTLLNISHTYFATVWTVPSAVAVNTRPTLATPLPTASRPGLDLTLSPIHPYPKERSWSLTLAPSFKNVCCHTSPWCTLSERRHQFTCTQLAV